jgi:cephalosporin-C deacetylase
MNLDFALPEPDDLDDFWRAIWNEAHDAPLDYHRSLRNDFQLPGFLVEAMSWRGIDGGARHGWIAYEPGARRRPAFLWIPPYGRESLLPNEYGTRSGMTSLSLNFHGHGAFHQEPYVPSRGYFAQGAAHPSTWVFRRMAADAMIAARVLQAQPEADEDRIGAMGMSQGGGMAIWLGAFCPVVRAVAADMPFLGNMAHALSRNAYRYPLKELVDFMETIPVGRETVLHTVSYYDTVNLAARCRVPTLVSLGEKDPACRPETVEAIYEAIPAKKTLVRYSGGHDWDPGMVDANRAWLLDGLGPP